MYNNCNDDFEKIKKKIDEENKKCKKRAQHINNKIARYCIKRL